jgi:hypothetical protein
MIIITIIRTLNHASFCVLHFMLPACRPNFANVDRTQSKAKQASITLCLTRSLRMFSLI